MNRHHPTGGVVHANSRDHGAGRRYNHARPALPAEAVGRPEDLPSFLLDDEAAAVYRHAVRRGSLTVCPDVAVDLQLEHGAVDRAVTRLLGLRLLRAAPGDPQRLAPLDPEVAAASLISPLEAEIHHRRDLITSIRAEMSSLRRSEEVPPDRTVNSLRALPDGTAVRGALRWAADVCRTEIVIVRPRQTDSAGALDEALARDLSTLDRGMTVRVLYQHAARADLTTRAYVRRIVAHGGQVRTTNHLSRSFVVVDRETAFTPQDVPIPGPGMPSATWEAGALEVNSSAVAQLLYDLFEDLWNSALPYPGAEAGYHDAANDIQKTIVKLLGEGLTDEAVARRVGMSLRACRRHIAALMRGLDSVSRFQAGTRVAKAGLVADE